MINNSNIFMHPDKFDRQVTVCPGYLIDIHPHLVWKDKLIKEITRILEKVSVDQHNCVYQRWEQIRTDAYEHSVPFFYYQNGSM